MKLTFYSNYFNHHQKALCDAFYSRLGQGFTFVETEPIEEFRSQMGWGGETVPSYVLKTYISKKNLDRAYELALESDLVIMGTAPEVLIRKRLEQDRLTFRYSERPLKEGRVKVLIPRLAKKFYVNHYKNRNKQLYILAAGAYCSSDYRFLHSYIDKCYKFGYFPFGEIKSFDELMKLKERNRPVRVLWTGRFLKLKRADLFIRAAANCAAKGLDFRISLVGGGEEEAKLKSLVSSLGLSDRTEFPGYLSPEETRQAMREANIFVMTSNKLEGWGSVIYEGLSSGCAVIASHAAGATPFLIDQGYDGLIFKSGSVASLTGALEELLRKPERVIQLGHAAYDNMRRYWNPNVAAERTIELAEGLLKGEPPEFEKGPLSRCEDIKDNWFKG
ncbi:MAG: glycosyltransferase family 4 protein [Lachnospiraceae bacterium]|nr:glycosyltransferase family 4 protein [Lachnospiraceae bacterium]